MSSTVGDYKVLTKIGRGSFADVYCAVHMKTGVNYALKVIQRDRIMDPKHPKLQENLDTEINIMRDYRHENVISLYENLHSRTKIYLVLELCPGGDLSQFIKKQGRLEEYIALKFLNQLSNGLQFLHEKKIIHRDLKPANILLTESSENAILKIADFGFARYLSEAALAETQCGTPLYMAPEIFDNQQYDGRADIWSVGCIFYEMLHATQPFRGTSAKDLLNNIRTKALEISPDIPISQHSIRLLQRMLTVSQTERINLDGLKSMIVDVDIDNLNSRQEETSSASNRPSKLAGTETGAGSGKEVSVSNNHFSSSPTNDNSLSKVKSSAQSSNLQPSPPTGRIPKASPSTITMLMNPNSIAKPILTYRDDDSHGASPDNRFSSELRYQRHSDERSNAFAIRDLSNALNIAGPPNDSSGISGPSASHRVSQRSRSTSIDESAPRFPDTDRYRPATKPDHPVGGSMNNEGRWDGSNSDGDYVIVDPQSSHTNDSSKNIFAADPRQNQDVDEELIKYFESTSAKIAKICWIGDSFIVSVNSLSKDINESMNELIIDPKDSSRGLRDDSEIVDRYKTALSIYHYLLTFEVSIINKLNDCCKRSESVGLTKLRKEFVSSMNQLLNRANQCIKRISAQASPRSLKSSSNGYLSSKIYNDRANRQKNQGSKDIPAAEPVLHALAVKLIQDASVDSMTGNIAHALETFKDAKMIVECLFDTCPEERKILSPLLQEINRQIDENDRTKRTLID